MRAAPDRLPAGYLLFRTVCGYDLERPPAVQRREESGGLVDEESL